LKISAAGSSWTAANGLAGAAEIRCGNGAEGAELAKKR
jgi:hypothetical protein